MTIRESALQGIVPKDLKIFDAHAHLGEDEYSNTFLYTMPVSESLELSSKIGINAIAASSLKAIAGQVVSGNEQIMRYCEMYPQQVFAYIFFSAHHVADSLYCIDRYKNHDNFVGVKIHPREDKANVADGSYDELYKFAVDNDILILCHTWQTEAENDPADFAKVLKRYPTLKLLIGHMGGTKKGCYSSLALANEYPNVYLDINGSLYSEIWIEELVKKAPLHKFIFSTDQTFNDPRIVLGRVLLSELSDDEKRKILYYNFSQIMGWDK